jgi:acetyltransferase-like isoleucine patch superfamily enzyme
VTDDVAATQRAALVEAARRIIAELQRDTRERWRRDLPLEELLGDRWERARQLGFGEGASIYQSSYVYGDVSVGRGTWIGPFTLLEGAGGLSIGSHCSISAGVQIYTHDSVRWALSGGVAEYERAPVAIGDCCHIGANAIVLKGVTIGDHCVIGAGSLVNRDIPPYTVAFGTPCRPAGRIEVGADGSIAVIIDRGDRG